MTYHLSLDGSLVQKIDYKFVNDLQNNNLMIQVTLEGDDDSDYYRRTGTDGQYSYSYKSGNNDWNWISIDANDFSDQMSKVYAPKDFLDCPSISALLNVLQEIKSYTDGSLEVVFNYGNVETIAVTYDANYNLQTYETTLNTKNQLFVYSNYGTTVID